MVMPYITMKIRGYFDLSVLLQDGMPIWPTNPPVRVQREGTLEKDGYNVESYWSVTHTGTHIDAPFHMVDGGATVDEIPIHQLAGDGYVIRPELEGREITEGSLRKVWKDEYDGNIVLINTGWDKKRAFTHEFQYDFPGLAVNAIDFLLDHRPSVIGIDTLGIEPYDHEDFTVHKALLKTGMIFIEDLANLDKLQVGKKYLVVALPLKIQGASGSMARVIALDVQ